MSEPLKTHFAIVGFPKCGTSALLSMLAQNTDVHVIAGPRAIESGYSRDIEMPLFVDRTELSEGLGRAGLVNGHKYSAYAFSKKALRNLFNHNNKMLIIVCVRHPRKSLISWHQMHRSFAINGSINHFTGRTPEDREFYMNCNLQEYYDRYAGSRLRYDFFVGNVFDVFPAEQVVVVAQERLALDPFAPTARISELLGCRNEQASKSEVAPHIGHADRVAGMSGLNPDVVANLDATHAATMHTIQARGHAPNIFV